MFAFAGLCLIAGIFPGLIIDGIAPVAQALLGSRMPVQTIFENLEAGLSVKEITEVFDVTEQEVKAVLHFATQSLEKAPAYG